MLFKVLDQHLPTFLAELDQRGDDLPWFVRRELEKFCHCGLPEYGAALARCRACGYERLVPWSCKGRGWCPRCTSRRMHDTATFLVGHVLPHAPVRMWVISFPPPLRYLLAFDAKLCAKVIRLFLDEVFAWLRCAAARELGLDARRAKQAQPGSVTFVQRFGDGLRANLHLHALVLDGVYLQENTGVSIENRDGQPNQTPLFHPLPPPTHLDLRIIGTNVWMRLTQLLQKLGKYFDADPGDADTLAREQPLLAACCAAAIQNTIAFGPRAGQRILRVGTSPPTNAEHEAKATATPTLQSLPTHGYDVHAGVRVPAQDRKRLERLCRYAARGPLADERLTLTTDGHVVLRLRRIWRDGTSHLVFTPHQLITRLIALVPPPRFNLTRFHGVLAPASKLRAAVVSTSEMTSASTSRMSQRWLFSRNSGRQSLPRARARRCDGRSRAFPRPRTTWSELLGRTFSADRNFSRCPRCHGKLEIVIAALPPAMLRQFLAAHSPSSEGNQLGEKHLARGPPSGQLQLFAGKTQKQAQTAAAAAAVGLGSVVRSAEIGRRAG